MSSIQIDELTKEFSTKNGRVTAVDRLSLSIADGEFVALLGPSGCGKSTTLRMLAGLDRPTAGEITVGSELMVSDQKGVFIPPERRKLGLVFQSYALWPHLTVADNIGFGLKVQRFSSEDVQLRTAKVLEMLQIAELGGRYPSELSGGQQQRVALARMLALDTRVLLLDEPLSNLDAALRLEMRAEIKRLHRELDRTVVFVTHDQFEALTMATQVAVMNEGRLEQYAPPMEVYRRPATTFVAKFVGSPPMALFDRREPTDAGLANALIEYMRDHVPTPEENTRAVCVVGIRPEDLAISSRESTELHTRWSHPARIDAVLPTGDTWIVALSIGDSSAFSVTHVEPQIVEGDVVSVSAALDRIHAFDEEGVRIEHELEREGPAYE